MNYQSINKSQGRNMQHREYIQYFIIILYLVQCIKISRCYLCFIPETNILLYISCISISKNVK